MPCGLTKWWGLTILISSQLYPKALWFEQKESPRSLEGFLNYSRSPFLSIVSFPQLSRSLAEISNLGSLSIPAAVASAGHPFRGCLRSPPLRRE
jgi:hypothetical protein